MTSPAFVSLIGFAIVVIIGHAQVPIEPVYVDSGEYWYSLTQSYSSVYFWTAPNTARINATFSHPTDSSKSAISIAAARKEWEPLLLIVDALPSSLLANVTANSFSISQSEVVEVSRLDYGGGEEFLEAIPNGTMVSFGTTRPTVLYINYYIPEEATGSYSTTIDLTGGISATIPVNLEVFDFELPSNYSYFTQINVASSTINDEEEAAKDFLFDHRLISKSVTWPSGFKPQITWENSNNPSYCTQFYDEYDEGPQYSIKYLAEKYLNGTGWTGRAEGVGFSRCMLFQFIDNDTPRPSTFCGISIGDLGSYDAEWGQYLAALENYLEEQGYIDKGYYYVMNEPQGTSDYVEACHLCLLCKAYAPNLKIAVSEEPKEQISGCCEFNIYIAQIRHYFREYAYSRQEKNGVEVWFYSLDHDPNPYPNPTASGNPPIHARIIPWISWNYRVNGWAYYDFSRFFSSHRPAYKVEMFREGIEDFEYLFLANGMKYGPSQASYVDDADIAARSVAATMYTWTRKEEDISALRLELGRYISGSRSTMPYIAGPHHNRTDAFYVNFQDPTGNPTEAVYYNGTEMLKLGWYPYNSTAGFGWYNEHIGDSICKTGYSTWTTEFSEAEKSYIYDDYGRTATFRYDCANGEYRVTLGVGNPARGYPNDPHNVWIQELHWLRDYVTTDEAPILNVSAVVEVVDGALTVRIGGFSLKEDEYAYTFIQYLAVEPTNASVTS